MLLDSVDTHLQMTAGFLMGPRRQASFTGVSTFTGLILAEMLPNLATSDSHRAAQSVRPARRQGRSQHTLQEGQCLSCHPCHLLSGKEKVHPEWVFEAAQSEICPVATAVDS
mmetsp:Transcript_29771/g.54848  ORF Transcript_29771/g.54848 Transcript_29771/m.54848 type:complete len:112 (+) Transcript_29771:1-336(+)